MTSRRGIEQGRALLLLLAGVAGLPAGTATHATEAAAARPSLATPDQLAAERLARAVLATAQVRAAKEKAAAALASDPDAQGPVGRAQAAAALDQWTSYLALLTVLGDTDRPRVITMTDSRPHQWGGARFPAVGVAISNPDNIYRSTLIDGSARYVISGRFTGKRPGQFTIELSPRDKEANLSRQSKSFGDRGTQLGMLTDDALEIGPDGRFTVTIGPEPAGGRRNHIQTVPGVLLLHYRDSLSDWAQTPVALSVRKLDPPVRPAPDVASLARQTAEKLGDYARFWQAFKNSFLGYPAPNALVKPYARDGGWGYAASGRFELADDEAIVITIRTGGARYTGVQVADPWMVTPDPRLKQVSLNTAQTRPDGDGRYTYVVSARDPGIANWIDTAGLKRGWIQVRWQGLKPGAGGPDLLVSDRRVKWSEVRASLPAGVAQITQRGRQSQKAERFRTYPIR